MGTIKRKWIVSGWKEHICSACGTRFRFRATRRVTGSGRSPAEAEVHAMMQRVGVLKQAVDVHPCPGCGQVQLGMVMARRARWHQVALWSFVITLPPLLYLAQDKEWGWPCHDVVLAALVIWAVTTGLHLAALFHNANHRPKTNLARAQAELADGQLVLVKSGERPGPPDRAPSVDKRYRYLAIVLLLAGGLGLGMAELVRLVAGWPLNPDWAPSVIGPGDTALVYYDHEVLCLDDRWAATAWVKEARLDGRPLPVDGFQTRSSSLGWGKRISVMAGNSSNVSRKPWQWVGFPPMPELAGKKLDLVLQLDMTWPFLTGRQFVNQTAQRRMAVSVQMSRPLAGKMYTHSFFIGNLAGGLIITLTGWGLRRRARRVAFSDRGQLIGADCDPNGNEG